MALGFSVLLLAGCVMPQSIRGTTSNPQQNFEAVERNPQIYQGQEVRFGGLVGSTVYDAKSNTTQLLLAVFPLDGLGQPDLDVHYQGVVLAYCAGYLNPEAYKGAIVTVVGPVIGYQDVVRNQTTYRYIQVRVNGFKNWGQATMENDASRQAVYDESQTFIAEEFNDSPAGKGWHDNRAVSPPHDTQHSSWINASHPVTPPVTHDAPGYSGTPQTAGYGRTEQYRAQPERTGGWQHRPPAMRDGNWQHRMPPVQGGTPSHETTNSRPAPHEMPQMHAAPAPHGMPQMHAPAPHEAPHMHSAPPPHLPPPARK